MATRVPVPEELLGANELERKLRDLCEQVELKKEEARSNFLQLHSLLVVREAFLLQEMDDIVTRVRQEVNGKKGTLQELNTAREGLERDLTKNTLKEVLEKNLRQLEDEIGKVLARDVTVGWIELKWKREQLEQSVIDVCRVVSLDEKPVPPVDYSEKRCLVWSRDATGSSRITEPLQLVIDDTTQNIFVTDFVASRIQVYDGEGNHLYQIPAPSGPIGLALTDEYIFVSAGGELVKIEKSSNTSIKSVISDYNVWGIDTNTNSDIYGCDLFNQSVIVFDRNLEFLKSIKLKTNQNTGIAGTYSIKLYQDMMYVMFADPFTPLPFHIQVFTQEGNLVRSLIEQSEIGSNFFFTIDHSGNIVVADYGGDQIKIFSNEGKVIHSITTDMLPGIQKIVRPRGIAIDTKNRIIVAQPSEKCNLLAL